MRYNLKLGVLLGVILGSLLTINVEAQGPFTAQIQRALNALLANGAAFTHASSITVNGNAATPTAGLTLANATLSTAGVPVQMPPCLYWNGHVWNTTAVAADNTDQWSICATPVSGLVPSSILKFGSSLNGQAATFPFALGPAAAAFGTTSLLEPFTVHVGTDHNWSITNTSAGALLRGLNDAANTYVAAVIDANPLILNTSGSGKVGFGTTSPGSMITVNGDIALTTSATGAGTIALSATAPTIASGGCTTGSAQSISASNGTAAFSVTLGGATCGNTIVLTMPTATTGWECSVDDTTTPVPVTSAPTSTTSVTFTHRTTAWVANAFVGAEVLVAHCTGY